MQRPLALALLIVIAACGPASASAPFIRADANSDARVDVSDAVFSLVALFSDRDTTFSCEKAADADGDGAIDVSDPIFTLSFLFGGSAAPGQPYPSCHRDDTDDGLYCLESACEPDQASSWLPRSPFGGQIVSHFAYTLEYDEEHELARWVAYHLSAGHTIGPVSRTDDYRPDPLVDNESADGSEYRGTGFDRGHLAPAGDMRWSETAMSESFYMSNISPQRPQFNRGVWVRLERRVRDLACTNGGLHLVVGPVLEPAPERIGPSDVSVPLAFFKVLLDYERTEAVGFVIPNEASGLDLLEFAMTVDEVEERTGIDFFAELPAEEQALFESELCVPCWEGPR